MRNYGKYYLPNRAIAKNFKLKKLFGFFEIFFAKLGGNPN